MIKELTLKNWKSFQQGTLFIDPLTIIIGANAAGKSNTLDALLFLQRVSSGVGFFQAINGDMNFSTLRGGMEWVCFKPERSFTLSVLVEGENDNQEYRYELSVQVNGTKAEVLNECLVGLIHKKQGAPKEKVLFKTGEGDTASPGIIAYFSSGSQGRGRRVDLSRSHTILSQTETLKLRKEVQDGARRVLKLLQGIFVFDPIPNHMRDYVQLSEQLLADGSNIAGVLAGMDHTRKAEVEKSLSTYLKALPERDILRIWAETVGKFKTDAMLYCEEAWGPEGTHEIDARGMSDGTLRFLAIVMALLTRKPGSLLVIEEVDNGLHPSRADILIKMLRELGRKCRIDVIITTHNPALLDAAGVGILPFITVAHREPQQGASHLTLLEDLGGLAKLLAVGSLGRLSTEGRIEHALKRAGGK